MTQAPDRRQDPLNRGGGWASSAPLYTWSSSHSRRRAPIYNRRYRYGPKAEYGAPRRQEKRQPHPGPWFQPPVPCWAGSSPWGCWGRPGARLSGGSRSSPAVCRSSRCTASARPACAGVPAGTRPGAVAGGGLPLARGSAGAAGAAARAAAPGGTRCGGPAGCMSGGSPACVRRTTPRSSS